jgi:hypothetical protein
MIYGTKRANLIAVLNSREREKEKRDLFDFG